MMTAVAQVAPLVRTGLLGGIAVGVLLYPVASLAGLAVKSGAEAVDSLPRQLLIAPSPQTTYVYAADGKTLLTTFYEEDRKYIPISQMSPLVRNAIVAAEDSRFFEHHGVDLKGTVRAFVANQQAGGVSQGASTLTMQYVRNVLRDAADNPQDAVDATAQDSARKLREMRLAIALEKRMSKTSILEGYLNVAYFGHRAYGISAASHVYFSTSPDQLTLDQAATIAGLVQAPSDYDPAGPDRSAALNRRNYVIDRMAALGDISPAQAAAAKAAPVALHLSELPNDCVSVPAARARSTAT